jgi:hypothetical protein
MIFKKTPPPVYGVLLLGFVIRLIAWANTSVINPDGAIFIHQAKAIYYGQLNTLFCTQDYLANYPVMIAGIYSLFHDWVFAARFVSFAFGFGTLIPVYFLLRRFFDDDISVLSTLVFAMMPVFVGSSVDLIRDPVFWFFAALGLYWFILGLEENTPARSLTWSCLALMMASWARVEASLLIAFSLLFLIVRKQHRELKKLTCFLLPLVALAASVIVAGLVTKGYTDFKTLVENAAVAKFSSLLEPYYFVSERLATTALQNRLDNFGLFLTEARKNMWLVAFGCVLNRSLEAYFYPFFLVFVMGFAIALKKFRTDQRVQYIVCADCMLLVVLYFHVMRAWYLDYRHMCLLILSSAIFIGFGIDRLHAFLQNRFHLRKNRVIMALALLITVLPLFKDLMPRDADKRVFREIGEFLASREGNNDVIPIATSCSNYRIISFYAHLDYRGAPCPEGSENTCWEYFADSFDHFIEHVKAGNIKYFLWSEKLWPTASGSIFSAPYNLHLKELKRWRHPDTGEMILYEVT